MYLKQGSIHLDLMGFSVNMRHTQLLILHQRIKDHRVQLGVRVEQSHAKKKKKAWLLH